MVLSHWFIRYFQGNKGVLVIYIDFLIFNSKKLLACFFYTLARGWRSCSLSDTFGVTWCSNLAFCHILRSATMPFFSVWRVMAVDRWFVDSDFFFLSILSLLEKIHVCLFFFSFYIFCCLFSSFSFLEKFFMFLI